VGVLPLEEIIIFSAWFPNSGIRAWFWPRVSNQGRKRSNLAYWPKSTSFEEECEMLPDLRSRLQMVLDWP